MGSLRSCGAIRLNLGGTMGIEITCQACPGNLHLMPDTSPLLLRCGEGHFQTVREIVAHRLAEASSLQEQDLRSWELAVGALLELARDAIAIGHVFQAADFQSAAICIADRLDEVRRTQNPPGGVAIPAMLQ